ncbi:ABC transporter permease [Paenibacillus sp. GSMTC-2017]|uniref:ABC transporter permease n=1 Tax=Paenibacillus sp. GSMTC-2017 TaxID=2794350 RepID=UPI0018DA2C50|nr:ABC transporter permease [Paenibacillus sp. GSMTC-2017]MBH5319915.1 ABC transporter permease [Paenibacillus sp. GSMTC-2017]
MLHLIKLEFKKWSKRSFVGGAFMAHGIMAAFLLLIYFTEGGMVEEQIFVDHSDMLSVIDTIVRATFIIYSSAILSRLIISEFRDKTMALLFTYPISRTKLISAKLTMVFVWTLLNVIIANVLLSTMFIVIDSQLNYIPGDLTSKVLYEHAILALMNAVAAAGMSLLPLIVGMRKKSVPATIMSSIFIVAIVCSNNGGFTLSSIIAIPLSLAAAGLILTYLSFRKIDYVDVS